MKIGYICANWKTPILRSKGPSVHIQEMCSALGDLGHEVFIVAANKGDEEAGMLRLPMIYEIKPEIPLLSPFYYTIKRLLSRFRGRSVDVPKNTKEKLVTTTWSPKIVWGDIYRVLGVRLWNHYFHYQAGRIIDKEQPDVLYERYDRTSSTSIRFAKKLGLPLILEMNGSLTFVREWAGHSHSPLYPFVARRIEKNICSRVDRVLVVSSGLERYLLDLGIPAEKIVVMPNAADPERFNPNVARAADIREKYGLGQEIVVGFIGSLELWHDLDLLLDSAKLVLGRCQSVRFLIAGDGELRTGLESRVRNEALSAHVTFTGYVPRHEAPAYINAMDIALAPFPRLPDFHFSALKIFEYMAAAKPVIASRYPDTETVIGDHYNGILVEPGDKSLLTQAILELLEDKELRERLGRQARQTVQEKYTWKGNAQRILKLYEEVQAVRINGRY